MQHPWDSDLAGFLNDLLDVQGRLLALLAKKRELLAAADAAGLAAMVPDEESLLAELGNCVNRRKELLDRAAQEGRAAGNIAALAESLPPSQRAGLRQTLSLATSQTRLLRHHSLTSWVVVQRTLLHLSQMLEIIATKGRLRPTYGGGEPAGASGALVDRAA